MWPNRSFFEAVFLNVGRQWFCRKNRDAKHNNRFLEVVAPVNGSVKEKKRN
jgi:hypothetical protein